MNDSNPYQRYMGNTKTHDFTLTPEDKTIVDAMGTEESPISWIQRKIVKPCQNLGNFLLNEEQAARFTTCAAKVLVPIELKENFIRRVTAEHKTLFAEKKSTIKNISNTLVNIGLDCKGCLQTPALKNQVNCAVTTILLESVLPFEERKRLGQYAARIADTNWSESDSKHISFCCFWDPVSESVQLGIVDEDGNQLRCVNQDDWVYNVPWEMYGVKLDESIVSRSATVITVKTPTPKAQRRLPMSI